MKVSKSSLSYSYFYPHIYTNEENETEFEGIIQFNKNLTSTFLLHLFISD